MQKLFCSLFIALFFIFTFENICQAEVLKCGVSDSTGIVGIDMLVGVEPVPIINKVFIDSPADKAGLKPRDKIVAIDHSSTYGLSADAVDMAISDLPGTKVIFTVLRGNHKSDFEVIVVPLQQVSEDLWKRYVIY